MTEAVLEITGLTVSYGQVRAVSDIHLSVQGGRITTLIGSNGAGKTTIMKGSHRPHAGCRRWRALPR